MKIDVGTERHIPNFSANFSSIPFIPCQIDSYFLYAENCGTVFKKMILYIILNFEIKQKITKMATFR